MAALYHDESRTRLFAQHTRKSGTPNGAENCRVDLLEWSPGDTSTPQQLIQTNAQALRLRIKPRLQIVFAPLDIPTHKSGVGIQEIVDFYDIPSDFTSQRLESVTHSFSGTINGSRCCSFFHFLCKNITLDGAPGEKLRIADPRGTNLSQGDWTWLRTSVFMRWDDCYDKDKASVVLVIFSASPELRDRCFRLWDTDLSSVLVDPFSLLAICLDELWLQAQSVNCIIRDVYGVMERTALDLAATVTNQGDDNQPDFVGLHNLAKHAVHLRESAAAADLIMTHLTDFHKELRVHPPQGLDAVPIMRLTGQMLAQKAVQFEVSKLRLASLEQRMQNVINLSFNVVTQQDSRVLKNDSKSMRAIASVTMAFLPLATIAAIFGSQFFNFDAQRQKIVVAHNFWIFWALIGPLSLAVSCLYYYMCSFHDAKRKLWSKER